jgi:hypothetical protein
VREEWVSRRWDPITNDWVDAGWRNERGPSELATLDMLEWSRLCSFVAGFASTSLGRQLLLEMQVKSKFD